MSDLLMLIALETVPPVSREFLISISSFMQSIPSDSLHLTSVNSLMPSDLLLKCSLSGAEFSSKTFPSANECSRGSPSCCNSTAKMSFPMPNRTADNSKNLTHKYADFELSIAPPNASMNFFSSMDSEDKMIFTTCDANTFSLTLLNPHRFEWIIAKM